MTTFDIDDALVRKLSALLEEGGLTEIEFAEGTKRIRVTRGGAPVQTIAVPAAPAAPVAAPAAVPAPAVASAAHPGALNSPMVGTAYLSPEPGAAAFVKAGDTVRAGQTLLIIEAMKVMNPIKAPKNGTVSQVLVQDGAPVEFGEVLLVIE
jgi:acetyl-CoA carboxylase biotin carboxyl carrier protein